MTARLSSLRQAVAAAAREGTALTNDGWAGQDDEVLLTQVVGIDIVDRVLELARRELAAAGEAADRVTVRRQDVAELTAPAAYDLVGLAAPFLSEAALDAALRRLIDALRPGGWIVLGTNRRRRTRCCWPSLAGRPS